MSHYNFAPQVRGHWQTLAAVSISAAGAASPALAHHAMDGQQPLSPLQGLAAGLAHPVLGLDHLAVLIGIGLLAASFRRGLLLPAIYIAAMGAGCALHLARLDLPFVEILVALSVVAIGLTAAFRPTTPLPVAAALFGAAGIAHGYALAESMIGAETGAVWAYLLGLVLIQAAVATSVLLMARWLIARRAMLVRLAAGGVAASGAVFLVLALST